MSKAVLISVRPEWCEKILAGEKTMEVRKTRPRLETPFKVYIYCTLAASKEFTLPVDVSKVFRVIVRQTGTHFCAVTYAECEDCKYAEKE